MPDDFGEAHDRELVRGVPRFEPGCLHARAADAGEHCAGIALAQSGDQSGAEQIARGFASDEREARGAEKPGVAIRDSGSGGKSMVSASRRPSALRSRRTEIALRGRLRASAVRPQPEAVRTGFSNPGSHRTSARSLLSMKSSIAATSSLSAAIAASSLRASASETVAEIKRAVRALDRADAVGVETAPLEAFGVDAARAAVVGGDHHERRHVAVDEAAHADERVRADAAELVHAGEARKDRVVADRHVARRASRCSRTRCGCRRCSRARRARRP